MKMSERSQSEDEMDIDMKEEFYQLASDGLNYEKIPDKYQTTMSPSTKDLPLSSRCRLCAIHKDDDMIDTFTIHETEGNITEKIEYCLRIVVNESDNLPQRICWFYSEELELCYQFNKIVEEANRQFRAPDKQTSVKLERTATDFRPSGCDSHCEALFDHSIDGTDSKSGTIAEGVPTTGSTVKSNLVLTSLESSSEVSDSSETLSANNLIGVDEEISSNDENQQVDSSTFDLNSGRTSALDIVQKTSCSPEVSTTSCRRPQPNKQTSTAQCRKGSVGQKSLAVTEEAPTRKRRTIRYPAGVKTKVKTAATSRVRHKRCDKSSIAPSDLKRYAMNLETKEFDCFLCHKSFKYLSKMEMHMLVHSDQRSWECDYCKKRSKTKGNLLQHVRFCQNRIYKCNFCATLFETEANLVRHMTLHTKEGRLYSCNYCGKKYAAKKNRDRHHRDHHRGRVFECSLRAKTYN